MFAWLKNEKMKMEESKRKTATKEGPIKRMNNWSMAKEIKVSTGWNNWPLVASKSKSVW